MKISKKIGAGLAVLCAVTVLVFVVLFAGGNGGDLIELMEVQISDEDKMLVERDNALVRAAIEAQESSIEDSKDWDWGLYRDLAKGEKKLGNLAGSRDAYESYLELNTVNHGVWNDYASLLEKMNDLKLAEDAYNQALELSPSEGYVRDLMSFWQKHYPEDSVDEQKELLEQAVTTIGRTPYFMIELGQWYLADGNCEEAIAHYKVLVDLIPDNPNAEKDLQTVKDQCSQL